MRRPPALRAALLTSDMLLLRQLAASGLIMLLLPLWRQRHPLATLATGGAGGAAEAPQLPPAVDPAAVAAGAAALRQAAAADPAAFAGALFQQLAHGHPLLGAEGQQRSARCTRVALDSSDRTARLLVC